MPVITAKRSSPCAVCGLTIARGESIDFTRVDGARHLMCADRKPERRYNAFATACHLCGAELAAGAGHLRLVEHEQDGAFSREWKASCVDPGPCQERMLAGRATQ